MFGTNKTFAERLSATKSVFQKALEDAKTLRSEMAAEVAEKNQQIAAIQAEIKDINAVEADTQKFITNLEGLV